MQSVVRPALPTPAWHSPTTHAAADNAAPFATRPDSTYKSGKAVQTTGATSEVIGKKVHTWDKDEIRRSLSPTAQFILAQHDDRFWYGYLGTDERQLLRVACEVVDRSMLVVQDISSLVAGGYYKPAEPVCENAWRSLIAGHSENASRIILTEGSTDGLILKDALQLLYPHLADYYSFLDFEATRSQGGAGHLAGIVKAFAGAGVSNRVVALFDNDTEGRNAIRTLSNVKLPPNIVALTYPSRPEFINYPTLGPGGAAFLDVNGLAASVELYLGQDVLECQGSPPYVQWRGYNEAMKAYQGEVMNKTHLQDAFSKKVTRCRQDPESIDSFDWKPLRALWESVFMAFP